MTTVKNNKLKSSLTPRQNEIYDFIKNTIRAKFTPPTIKEIMLNFKLKSTNGVNDVLNVLEHKGYIIRQPGKARGIELCETLSISPIIQSPVRKAVIVGSGSADNSYSIFMSPVGEILLDQNFFPNNVFVSIVSDDAMDKEGILKNDLVIVKQCNDFENDNLVFAISGNNNVIRRLSFLARGEKFLIAANRYYNKINVIESETVILGLVIGLIRKM
ncbi:MAG: hypothetical protein IPP08_09220 [Chlorobiota bacterium]|nr:MAG: hypothetical protein IPP08_09220 [Chlorobiota bacterium]